MWKPIEVTLCWPVKDDKDQEIKVLVLKPITRGDHKAVLDEVNAEDERKVFEKFASISCGLTADEVKRLSYPDYNSLIRHLSDYVARPASFFAEQDGKKLNADSPELLVPIKGDTGEQITQITLKVPTVQSVDIMNALPDNQEAKTEWLTQDCSGLSKAELSRLSTQDWNQLQGRLNDFLNKTADYFLAETSK